MITISVFNLKGGTAKSTTALNLAACLAEHYLTTIIDLDGQSTLSFGLGLDGRTPTALDWLLSPKDCKATPTAIENLSLMPGDLQTFKLSANKNIMAPALKTLKALDLCFCDCPPSLSTVSVQSILSADRVLVPVIAEPAALRGLASAVRLIRDESPDKPIDVVRCRCRPRLVLTREADEMLVEASADMNFRLLHTSIPENVSVAESIAAQQPVCRYAEKSAGAVAYRSLAKEVSKVWGLR